MTDLQLAKDEVEPMLDQIETHLSNEVAETALGYAKRADMEHPINRSPRVVAGASIYLAALLCNEAVTQSEIHNSCDVSMVAIREAYQEIAECEGIELTRTRRGQRNRSNSLRPKYKEYFGVFGGSNE